MTITYYHWELNGQEVYGPISLAEMEGQKYINVSREPIIEMIEKLVENRTDIRRFYGIKDNGDKVNLLKEYFNNKTIYFCNFEKIKQFEAVAEIKYSDLNPHQNFK